MTVLQLKKDVQLFDVESYIPKCTIAHHAIQIQDAHDGMQKPRCTFCNSKAKRCPCNAKPYAHYAMQKPRCTLCNAKTHMHNMKCKNQTSTVQWQGYYAAVYLSIFVLACRQTIVLFLDSPFSSLLSSPVSVLSSSSLFLSL